MEWTMMRSLCVEAVRLSVFSSRTPQFMFIVDKINIIKIYYTKHNRKIPEND